MDSPLPAFKSVTVNIDGLYFTIHVLDDERGTALRKEWLLYLIEAVLPKMNPATLFQVKSP